MSFVTAMVLMWLLGSAVVAGILAICLREREPGEHRAAERLSQPMPGPATVISQDSSKPSRRRPNWAT